MIGIIIQARMGSTRLKNKMLLPFTKEQGLLEFLLKRLAAQVNIPMVIATSLHPEDDAIASLASQFNIDVFRGSSGNVLKRFCDAAESHRFKKIIRVCGDNPFLDLNSLDKLIMAMSDEGAPDYLSFQMSQGQPAIKSHLGLYCEGIRLEALMKVQELTKEPLYQEHVTNYIYENPDQFIIQWLKPSELVYSRKDLRFTVDTETDLEVVRKLNDILEKDKKDITISGLLSLVDQQPSLISQMKTQIEAHAK